VGHVWVLSAFRRHRKHVVVSPTVADLHRVAVGRALLQGWGPVGNRISCRVLPRAWRLCLTGFGACLGAVGLQKAHAGLQLSSRLAHMHVTIWSWERALLGELPGWRHCGRGWVSTIIHTLCFERHTGAAYAVQQPTGGLLVGRADMLGRCVLDWTGAVDNWRPVRGLAKRVA
jgi:hypothetical protein